ncbi:hypothetical protein GGF32_004298 [Allomyces javanicus]|nr:hypothetical protein GGF32_004298 [Allomyces javanicus]
MPALDQNRLDRSKAPGFVPKDVDLRRQAIAVPGSAQPGSTPVYRNALLTESLSECSPVTKAKTLYDNFFHAARAAPNAPCLGHRPVLKDAPVKEWGPYTWQTYAEVADRMTHFGSGLLRAYDQYIVQPLREQGVAKKDLPDLHKWNVGIYSINRPEWVITEGACNCYSLVSVALYDTLGPDVLEFIVNHAELPVVVTSADKIMNLIRVREQCPGLKVIVSMDPLDSTAATYLKLWASDKNLALLSFAEVEDLGKTAPLKHFPPAPADLATINYTSGTTGNPKGAMLTHGNLASQNNLAYYDRDLSNEDLHLSYLPLSHIYERSVTMQALGGGARVAFYRGDVLLLVEDIATVQPTIFVSVPRLFNRIYAKVRAQTLDAPGIRGALFRKAYAAKLARLESGGGYEHALWDRILFNKVKQALGGKVKLMISGSAPIQRDVLQFFRIMFVCEVLEGYGQTENGAGATCQLPGEYTAGHVGAPFPNCEIKLVDIPDMNYRSTDTPHARGEICIRGPNVFVGYWKDVEKTKETIDEEGWLHTGDVGKIDHRGCLSIIDRKKALLKLSQGEYVAPEKLENVYALCPLVQMIFVHGDSLQSELVAMVVPEPEAFLAFVKTELGFGKATVDDIPKLCKDPKVVDAVLHELTVIGKEKKLRGFEYVKAIHLEPNVWTVESGFLTPSFKLKRQPAAEHYRAVIDAMYAKLAADQKAGKNGARAPIESLEKAKL